MQVGWAGGSQSHTLTVSEIPAHHPANTLTDPGHLHRGGEASSQNGFGGTNGGVQASWFNGPGNTNSATTGITISNADTSGGNPHSIVQATICCNCIIRVA
jgi:microcystin-dependent protein